MTTPMRSTAGVLMQWGVKIPLRDGVQLSATLYRPSDSGRSRPAVFTFTPYVAQVSHDVGVYFAANGYPFLVADVRGRGNSDGQLALGAEAPDCFDVVEWLARQSYCNGKVTMWGGSYSGYLQWLAAKEFPPHLVSIVPVASPYRGVDSPFQNNIFLPYRMQWLNLIAGRTSQDKVFADQSFWNQQFRRWFESGKPFKEIDEFLGNPSEILQEWIAHPTRDAYWDGYNPTHEQYARISIPILTITGIYDANQRGALEHYHQHTQSCSVQARASHFLVIGPWDHAGTRVPKAEFGGLTVGSASLVDLSQLHLDWYAWTAEGGPKPPFLKKRVAYYVMGAEEWRYTDALEQVTTQVESLYLRSSENPSDVLRSGLLMTEAPGASRPDHYRYDPRDLLLSDLESKTDPATLTDQRMLHASVGKQLVYHSLPFDEDTEVSGFFKLSLWLAIDQPDTDFRVSIHEIGIDGSSMLLSYDLQRARYRTNLRKAKLVDTKEALRYDFDSFHFVSRRISKGKRLRLVVGPVNSIFSEKNYNTGGVVAEEGMECARTVTVRLFHDEAHPSMLQVPLGKFERL